MTEAGFEMQEESWRRPDVCFVRAEKFVGIDRKKPLVGAPDLVVEVVSPSDSKRVLARKVEHFLQEGTQVAWVVYPDSQEVNVITKTANRWLGPDDTIDEPSLLPGFSEPVRSLFE